MADPITYLFVPGDRPERFGKAAASGADRVILDLEDAVRPEAKPAARAAICAAGLDLSRIVVRINDAASPFLAEDLACIARARPGAVMLPKAETRGAIDMVAEALPEADILPQIETVRGLEAVPDLLAHRAVRRVVFGHLDFALDLGAAPEWEALLYARSRVVALSRLAGGAPPIDSVTTDVTDPERTAEDARRARALGFGGKLLIHPAQVAPAMAAFRPGQQETDWARRVLDAVAAGAGGAAQIDGKMIDKPVEEAARRILARAARADA